MQFLSGDTEPIQRDLERRMRDAAKAERFEEAARYRNRLFSIQHLAERQAADRRDVGDVDVLGIALDGDRGVVQIFPLRGGKMIDRYSFHLENVEGQDLTAVLESFSVEYYGATPSMPPQIVVPKEAGDLSALEEFLTERRGSRVEVRRALRGEKRRLAELAADNAQQALDVGEGGQPQLAARAARRRSRSCARRSTSSRCRCGSSATTSRRSRASETVGSMVVFEDAAPKKAHYRKFAVRSLDGQDDFAAMAEVVSRRFARLGRGTDAEYDESFVSAPNLVVIDGGKGQLSAALAAMQSVRPAARRGDRAGEARRRGLRAGTARIRSCSTRTRRDCSSCSGSATRPTASRSASTASAATRARSRRSSTRCRASDRRGGGRSCATSARPSASSRRRRRSSKACPSLPAATARKIYAQLHKAGRGA